MSTTKKVLRMGPVALVVRRRVIAVHAGVALAIVAVAIVTLTLGRLGIPLPELPAALLGGAEGKVAFVLERWRGPRLVTAVFAGGLLGMSGALFQAVTRNPLGSPDVIGLGAGAGAGAATASLFLPGFPSAVAAVGGAGIATLAVFGATGRGFASPARTIIAGIAVSALAFSITQYVVSAKLRDAATHLAEYLTGSLNSANDLDIIVSATGAALLIPAGLAIGRAVSLLELGDDAAAGLGVDPQRTRTRAVILSVLASGVAVAATGPVAFVALTAPQITKRLTGPAGVGIVGSALTGAFILSAADLAAQQAPIVSGLPVGVLTMGVGGLYLGYLLVQEHREGQL